jgi:DnaK suppressor protein
MVHAHNIDTSLRGSGAHFYSELLLAEKAQLQSKLYGQLKSMHTDHAALDDQPATLHEQFVSHRVNQFVYRKIKAIDTALQRLRSGRYGICEECEEPISQNRLEAVPWTRYCIQCQENLGDPGSLANLSRTQAA